MSSIKFKTFILFLISKKAKIFKKNLIKKKKNYIAFKINNNYDNLILKTETRKKLI